MLLPDGLLHVGARRRVLASIHCRTLNWKFVLGKQAEQKAMRHRTRQMEGDLKFDKIVNTCLEETYTDVAFLQ